MITEGLWCATAFGQGGWGGAYISEQKSNAWTEIALLCPAQECNLPCVPGPSSLSVHSSDAGGSHTTFPWPPPFTMRVRLTGSSSQPA